jgi:hypothetical protein
VAASPEQVQQMKDRAAALGPNAQSDAERAWKQLAAEVRAEFDRGTPTSAPAVQALARRWRALIDDITGGDEGIRQGLVALHRAEPSVTANFFGQVVDHAVLKYIFSGGGGPTQELTKCAAERAAAGAWTRRSRS